MNRLCEMRVCSFFFKTLIPDFGGSNSFGVGGLLPMIDSFAEQVRRGHQ